MAPPPASRPSTSALAQIIIVWGNNVTWSNLHLTPLINQARRAGAKLVVVDPCAPRSPSRPTCTWRSGPAPTWCWRGPSPPSSSVVAASTARSSPSTSRASRPTWRRRGATPWPRGPHWAVPRRRSASSPSGTRTSRPRRSAGNGLERDQNGGAASARSSRCPRSRGSWACRGWIVNGAGFRLPKTPAKLSARISSRRARAPSTSWTWAAPPRSDAVAADQGGVHLQPQPARRPSRPEPDAARARPRGPVHCRARRGDDGQPGLRGRGPARVRATSSSHDLYASYGHHWLQRAEPVIPPGRGAAQHRDLPPARRPLRFTIRSSRRATPS